MKAIVQLPRFLEQKADLSVPLHCWLFTLWEAHRLRIMLGDDEKA